MKAYLRLFFWVPISRHKTWLFISLFSLGMLSVAQSMFILLVGPFLKAVFLGGSGAIGLIDILPRHIPLPQMLDGVVFSAGTILVGLPVMIVGAGWVKAAGGFVFLYSQEALACFVAGNYRVVLFDLILKQSLGRFRRRGVGEWMSQIMNDVLIIQTRFSDVTTSFGRDLCLAGAALLGVFLVNWRAGIVVAAICPFGAAILGRASKRIAYFAEQFQLRLAATAGAFLNVRARFGLIRAEHGETFEFGRFDRILKSHYRMIRRSLFLRSSLGPGMEFFGFAVFAGFLWFLTRGDGGQVQNLATEGIQLIVALAVMLRPLRNIGEQISKWQEIRGALNSGYQTYLDVLQNAASLGKARTLGASMTGLPDEVRIDSLEVDYDQMRALVLNSVTLRRGKAYAIIGPSGAGKSTFVKVLAGLIEPRKYESSVSLEILRQTVAFVSQDPFFFEGSVRENLSYEHASRRSHSAATSLLGDEQILSSLTLVNLNQELAEGRIDQSYQGIGGNFSGGQLQRLVIAREILRQKDIVVLDEPTSAVDPKSEREISERLIAYCRSENKILVFVTHRLQHLALFDEIWFFEGGRVLGTGAFDTMLKNPRIKDYCS